MVGEIKTSGSPSRLTFIAISLIMLTFTLLGLNYYHAYRCAHVRDNNEVESSLNDMKRRLREMESRNIYNALVVKNVLSLLRDRLKDREMEDIEAISAQGEDRAVAIALQLAATPDLHQESFDLDPKFRSADALLDQIDLSLASSTISIDSNDGGTLLSVGRGGSTNNNRLESALDESQQTEKCKHWQQIYRVVVGQSWGDLPIDLQRTWVDMDCDSKAT
jgi:hypothetical protein